jgi:hypothetical protein
MTDTRRTYNELPDLPAINHLKSFPQWVSWRYEERNGEPTKPLINPRTGRYASHSNPRHWGTYEEAHRRTIRDQLEGEGFVLSQDDNITGADLDDVRDPNTGELAAWAAEIVALAETYIEVSPSGTGLRILWDGKIDKTIKKDGINVEIYRDKRYLTITGNHVPGTPTKILSAPRTEAALRRRVDAAEKKATVSLSSAVKDNRLDSIALANLDSWVLKLFGDAAKKQSSGGYRVSSADLGRQLQEDLSLHPDGIKDFGVHDMGDEREGKRTPTEVVMEHGKKSFYDAMTWLKDCLGIKEGVSVDDFYAYMPMHAYIFAPSREMWPAASVNSRIPPIPMGMKNGEPQWMSASQWLDKHRHVEQMTWAPGMAMIIKDLLIADGGWIEREEVSCFNLYRESNAKMGDKTKVGPWLRHGIKVFGKRDFRHILAWLAHRVQHPSEKINHALVLGGKPGIGKDTLLEPVRYAIGDWNFKEASPIQVMGRFNAFLKSVILRVNEVHDLGEYDRFQFYDHMKVYEASPPNTLCVDEKNLREHYVMNVCGVIITTNHKADGIYLTEDDRRHYVAWSDLDKTPPRLASPRSRPLRCCATVEALTAPVWEKIRHESGADVLDRPGRREAARGQYGFCVVGRVPKSSR